MSMIAMSSTALVPQVTVATRAAAHAAAARAGWDVFQYFENSGTDTYIGMSGQVAGRRAGSVCIDTGAGASPSMWLRCGYRLRPDGSAMSAALAHLFGAAALLINGGSVPGVVMGWQAPASGGITYWPIAVRINSDRSISVGHARTSGSSVLWLGTFATSSAGILSAGTAWAFFELFVRFNTTTNFNWISLHVDGTEVVSWTTETTADANSFTHLAFGSSYDGAGVMDVAVWDDSGLRNNDFRGDCRVEALVPTSDVVTEMEVVGAGSHYDAVNDPSSDADSTYLRALVGQKDIFGLSDLGSTSGTVYAVQVTAVAKKESSSARVVRGVARISGTDYVASSGSAAANPPQSDYGPVLSVFEANPNTNADWAASEVNALTAGVTLVS